MWVELAPPTPPRVKSVSPPGGPRTYAVWGMPSARVFQKLSSYAWISRA